MNSFEHWPYRSYLFTILGLHYFHTSFESIKAKLVLTDQLRRSYPCFFVLLFMIMPGCRFTPLTFLLCVINIYKGLMMIMSDITWSGLVVIFFEHFILWFQLTGSLHWGETSFGIVIKSNGRMHLFDFGWASTQVSERSIGNIQNVSIILTKMCCFFEELLPVHPKLAIFMKAFWYESSNVLIDRLLKIKRLLFNRWD